MATREQPTATGWPLAVPWDAGGDGPPGQPAPSEPATRGGWPPASWPTAGQLDYTQKLITVLLLLLALPWLVSKLLTRPGDVLTGLGRRAAGKATT